MTWRELGDLLNEETEKLLKRGLALPLWRLAPSPYELPKALLELQKKTKPRMVLACTRFAEKRTWPRLTIAESSALWLRLEHAAALADLLASPRPQCLQDPSLDEPEEHVLCWLLTQSWERDGFPELHSTIEYALRGTRRGSAPEKAEMD